MTLLQANVVVQLDSAGVRFGRVQALQSVSLHIERGESLALVGANGSGKSTLLRLAHGLVKPTSGAVKRSQDLRQAFVFQRPFVLRSTVLANVALAVWLGGMPWVQAKARAMQALNDVDMQALATRQARTLSGGQLQRLAFARALAVRPELLLLDEPTASLAPEAKRDVEALMAQCTARGMTLIFASHNLGQVKRLATRVVCLDAGRVVADKPTAEFFNHMLPQLEDRLTESETL
jgi:tungstate transport system ATP-binding protein